MNPSQPTASREVSVADAGRAAEPDSHGPVIPDHQLLVSIAAGAYGEVWLARNAVGTLRAVKIVRRDQHASSESFEREFKGLQKFEPISRTNEGLVDILTLGLLPEGAGFYYVMELADGVGSNQYSVVSNQSSVPGVPPAPLNTEHWSLNTYKPRTLRAELKTRGALPADEVIVLGLKLCSSLAYLHASGLVHRDVKPSNILFIGGEPKLADAGLVAAVDDARSLVGTAGYIAPEGPGTPQADLYALGKVLYEAAFGKDRQEFPALPADVASRPDHARLLELNAILLKACATDRNERYQSEFQMRADLEFLHAGYSVKRRHVWQRTLSHATKLALALGVLAGASAIVYSFVVRRPRPPEFVWSKSAQANNAFRNGELAFKLDSDISMEQAVTNLQRAVELDPSFARAKARLAITYIWMSGGDIENLTKARSLAQDALSVDSRVDDAHHAMGVAKALLDHDWTGAEQEFQKAIQLNPKNGENLYAYAAALSLMGRTNEALAQLDKAQALDSGTILDLQSSAFVAEAARDYDRVLKYINDVIDKVPSSRAGLTARFLVPAYRGKREYMKAIQLEEESDPFKAKKPDEVQAKYDSLRKAFAENGAHGYWIKQLDWEKDDGSNPVRLAILHARVGNKDQAFHYLDLAVEKVPTQLCFVINREPGFDSLRSDPRFANVLRKFKLGK